MNIDMLQCAYAQFVQEPRVKGVNVVVLMEITMSNLLASGELDHQDFLARVDVLGALGNNVLISNYSEYYRLTSYFRRYTTEMVGVAMGINNLLEVFNEKYYDSLLGGILDSFGRMFRNATKLYIYPMRQSAFNRYVLANNIAAPVAHEFASDVFITAKNLRVASHLANLYAYLLENHYLDSIVGFDSALLDTFSRDVLKKIADGEATWEAMVPAKVAELIRERKLFGYHTPATAMA